MYKLSVSKYGLLLVFTDRAAGIIFSIIKGKFILTVCYHFVNKINNQGKLPKNVFKDH